MDKTASSTETTRKLRDAIRKLEAYTLQQMESAGASSVSKTISLVRAILTSSFEGEPKQHRHQRHPPNKNEVLNAIAVINSNRMFIKQLNEGTPAEQELAEEFTRTIDTYNESCDKRIQGWVTGRERLVRFFSKAKQEFQKLPKIALPKKVTTRHHYPEDLSPKIQQLSSKTGIAVPITKQSAELFHMKAIALLERYGIASNPEARAFVKQSPILTAIQHDASICTWTQTLSLFPGQTVIVIGTSKLDPKTQAITLESAVQDDKMMQECKLESMAMGADHSQKVKAASLANHDGSKDCVNLSSSTAVSRINQLFPETFSLSLESTQTGFPHPIQRAGWTVASQLLPDFPQRIDLLKQTAELFHKRNVAITGLAPKGNLLKHAKRLLSLKKKCFDIHAKELIGLHKKLSLTILENSSAVTEAYGITERFYASLQTHPTPLDFLAETSQMIREYFMVRPHQHLLDAIIKGKSTNFGSNTPTTRYVAAKALLTDAVALAKDEMLRQKREAKLLQEKIKWDFIESFGTILGTASRTIFLQHLSEDLIFSPPDLNPFERKVQTAAYTHLEDFLNELSTELPEDSASGHEFIYKMLKDQINADIALFQEEKLLPISEELSEYFKNRYASLSAI